MTSTKTKRHVASFLAGVDYEGGLIDFALLLNKNSAKDKKLRKLIEDTVAWFEIQNRNVDKLLRKDDTSKTQRTYAKSTIITALFLKGRDIAAQGDINFGNTMAALKKEGQTSLATIKKQVESDFLYELYRAVELKLKRFPRFAAQFEEARLDVELVNAEIRTLIKRSSDSKNGGENGALVPTARGLGIEVVIIAVVVFVAWFVSKQIENLDKKG